MFWEANGRKKSLNSRIRNTSRLLPGADISSGSGHVVKPHCPKGGNAQRSNSGPLAMPSVSPQPFILSMLMEDSVKASEDGETAQRFRELFTLAEDPGSILSTHVMAHRHL